jgi:CheY-like chemotaxis protein
VLYVEDNQPNIRLVQSMFAQRAKVELLVATEGERGLRMARERDPDLVLLDLNLPDSHGVEILGRLKSDPSSQAIPVVVLSPDATAAQSRRLLLEGASPHLTKPIDVREFLDCVAEELGCLG